MFNFNNPIFQKILNSKLEDVQKSPQYQEVLKMTYGKSPEQISAMVDNMARQYGINPNELRSLVNNR